MTLKGTHYGLQDCNGWTGKSSDGGEQDLEADTKQIGKVGRGGARFTHWPMQSAIKVVR